MTNSLLHDKRIAHCQNMIDHCVDTIKNLQGDPFPDGVAITLSIKGRPLVTFDVGDNEANFAVGFFMAWHQHYSRCLKLYESEQRCAADKQGKEVTGTL